MHDQRGITQDLGDYFGIGEMTAMNGVIYFGATSHTVAGNCTEPMARSQELPLLLRLDPEQERCTC